MPKFLVNKCPDPIEIHPPLKAMIRGAERLDVVRGVGIAPDITGDQPGTMQPGERLLLDTPEKLAYAEDRVKVGGWRFAIEETP